MCHNQRGTVFNGLDLDCVTGNVKAEDKPKLSKVLVLDQSTLKYGQRLRR